MSPWIIQNLEQIDSLSGLTIRRWIGTEISLTEDREGGELWYDESVPWLQMILVFIEVEDGQVYSISNYQ